MVTGKICPEDLKEPEWKLVCKNGCFLVVPKDLFSLRAKADLVPDLTLNLEELKIQRNEALEQRDLYLFQRDRALDSSSSFEALWELQKKENDKLKKKVKEKFSFWEFMGGVGGGFVGGAILTTATILLLTFSL